MRKKTRGLIIVVVAILLAIAIVTVSNATATEVQAEQTNDTVVTIVVTPTPMPTPMVETVAYIEQVDEDDPDSDDAGYNRTLYILAKLIHGEAGIDSYKGKLAVGTVVMNRAEHWNTKLFGGPTIEGVILHKFGEATKHQFSCVDDDDLWAEEPTEDDYRAAMDILSGYRSFNNEYVYYYNPDISKGIKGIQCKLRVGMHVFGKEPNK